MHELSLAYELIAQVTAHAAAHDAIQVNRVVVQIGRHSGVEADAFEFAFPMAAEGSIAEKAILEIQTLPVTVECLHCRSLSHPEPIHLVCGCCGSTTVELRGGQEFTIRSIELELPDDSDV